MHFNFLLNVQVAHHSVSMSIDPGFPTRQVPVFRDKRHDLRLRRNFGRITGNSEGYELDTEIPAHSEGVGLRESTRALAVWVFSPRRDFPPGQP